MVQLLDLLAKPAASKTAQANFHTSSVTIIFSFCIYPFQARRRQLGGSLTGGCFTLSAQRHSASTKATNGLSAITYSLKDNDNTYGLKSVLNYPLFDAMT